MIGSPGSRPAEGAPPRPGRLALRHGGRPLVARRRLAAALGSRLPRPGQRIGLLGGSFNPAHAGHRHISLLALQRLGLDGLWWLVSPQNPLKPSAGMAPHAARIARAEKLAKHRDITVTGIESVIGTQATADTLAALTRYFPGVQFVWIMGADNLQQIARWERWPQIFHAAAIAVFDRPTYSHRALAAKAARRFRRARVVGRAVGGLATRPLPAWAFLPIPLSKLSATDLRRLEGG
ncbi:nicotinate-nucleotide adenylyltransferase [Tistlia consotensis]|uniref:Probable nicotinate-nucleotide adenylyltransferase n=1 Tax=Tistlia consotensis USBA 355 TaxID=560819 RepID=A0A1Y6BGL8_9PROT|nr:nicotinate-nucleotide adenylyltransferase [Tistlia consotensis]SMF08125.1 nicotinate-nucleotide adenylyltransferase [Tistlia consotensis USBA 355]SNR35529.1 nicotinate-nucleotide adenylyltransferase [Tistlia consotensis]